jgi:hypothetical protein
LKKFAALGVGGFATVAVALGISVGFAGRASAIETIGQRGDMNPYNYRDELRVVGLYHEDVNNAASLGPRICAQRAMGYTEIRLIDSLIGPDPLYSVVQSFQIVEGAEWHFCPGYYSLASEPWPAPPPPPPGWGDQI